MMLQESSTQLVPSSTRTMTNSTSLLIGNSQRGALIGKTGSGKTYLAKEMIARTPGQVCVIDPKRMFLEPGDKERLRIDRVFSTVASIKLWKPKRFVYRPGIEDLDNYAAYDELYKWCYMRGDILIYTDDMTGVIPSGKSLRYLQICYQMGRQKKVAMLTSMQRPVNYPLYIFSDSEKFYTFRLNQPADIKRVQSFVPNYDPLAVRTQYSFFYYDDLSASDGRVCILGGNNK